LSLSGFRKTQIIEPEIRRKVGLIMPLECGFRPGRIRPVGKPFSPPRIVFRDPVKLREVKRNRADSHPPPADSRLTNTAKNMLIKTWCVSTAILRGPFFHDHNGLTTQFPIIKVLNEGEAVSPIFQNIIFGYGGLSPVSQPSMHLRRKTIIPTIVLQ